MSHTFFYLGRALNGHFRRERGSIGATLALGYNYDHLPGVSIGGYTRPRDCWNVGAHVTVGGEDAEIRLSVGLLAVAVYIGIKHAFPHTFTSAVYAWAKRRHEIQPRWWAHQLDPFNSFGRSTGFSIGDAVSVEAWRGSDGAYGPDGDHSDWPWRTNGWSWRWGWWDALVGPMRHEREPGMWNDAEVHMDGRTYPMRVNIYRVRWRRNIDLLSPNRGRWLFRASIEARGWSEDDPDVPKLDRGWDVPGFAGKGENSWDCGDDCVYAMTVAAKPEPYTIAEVVAEYVASVERSRARYGMPSGRPGPESDIPGPATPAVPA